MIIQDNPNVDKQRLELRMIVAGHNSSGEPDLYFCKVQCYRDEYNEGEHYALAERMADHEGCFEGHFISFDEHDIAGRNMLPLFQWDTATVYKT